MRYRLFDHQGNVFVFKDSPAFHGHFLGRDPNNPVGGIVRLEDRFYEVEKYDESCKESSGENVFHEPESDWYAHLRVKQIIMGNTRLVLFAKIIIRSFFWTLLRMMGIGKPKNFKQDEWGHPYEDFA